MKPLSRIPAPSVTMSLDQQARALAASGADVINLTAGQVDLPMPEAGKTAIRAALTADRTGYVPAAGSADVKDAVRRRMGWNEGSILISAGAKPLLYAAIACVAGPGDEVLLLTPCYTSYPEMIRLSGAVPVPVFRGERIEEAALAARLTDRTKAIVVNNPVNPTGAVLRADELETIAGFACAHDLFLIADEVYHLFVHDGDFTSFYDFSDARARLILVNSASKTYAMAGLRLGFAVAPEPVAEAITGFLSHAVGCPCSLSERAAKAVLEADGAYAGTLRETFRRRRDRICAEIARIPGVRAHRCEGAFYLWLDVSAVETDDVLFCQKLLAAEGVALTPGSAFLCPGHVRIAYTKPEPQLIEASARLDRFVRSYRSAER
ncbi:MAG: aminotransferase class I/II-fold pyridoxal phosphate-dependent enzyme [Clostridia bacterium]|nr:aminotransferase class I/II-fold pyridoxal phosphate-dependent enzyme [Clostridia bacterium]